MIKNVTKGLGLLSGVLLLLFTVLLPIEASAKEWPDLSGYNANYDDFEMNDELYDFLAANSMNVYDFQAPENSRVTITVEIETLSKVGFALGEAENMEAGSCMATKADFKCEKVEGSDYLYKCTYSFNSEGGFYDFYVIGGAIEDMVNYHIVITSEKQITLDTTAITGITNTKQRTMTVSYNPVKKRLGYQIEYSTDNKFKDKARVNTGATSKDIGKLTRGKTYYVRVRSYARYSDGGLVYSKWSGTRKIKITN